MLNLTTFVLSRSTLPVQMLALNLFRRATSRSDLSFITAFNGICNFFVLARLGVYSTSQRTCIKNSPYRRRSSMLLAIEAQQRLKLASTFLIFCANLTKTYKVHSMQAIGLNNLNLLTYRRISWSDEAAYYDRTIPRNRLLPPNSILHRYIPPCQSNRSKHSRPNHPRIIPGYKLSGRTQLPRNARLQNTEWPHVVHQLLLAEPSSCSWRTA